MLKHDIAYYNIAPTRAGAPAFGCRGPGVPSPCLAHRLCEVWGRPALPRGRTSRRRGALRPVSVPTFWISEGLTQAES